MFYWPIQDLVAEIVLSLYCELEKRLWKLFIAGNSTIEFLPHQVFTYKQRTITHEKVTAMHPMNEEGVDDMATLTEFHGGSIMHNLHQRYKRNQIYVSST